MNQMAFGYIQSRIQTASPLELVVILYEGAIQKLNEADRAIRSNDIPQRVAAINHASRFLAELQVSLDFQQGGELAANLQRLYVYFQSRLIEANTRNSVEILSEVITHLRGLHGSWAQLARQTAVAGPRSDSPDRPAGSGLNISI